MFGLEFLIRAALIEMAYEVIFGRRDPIRNAERVGRKVFGAEKTVTRLKVGCVVYCNLAGIAEHTGVYVGRGKIAHLDGSGRIELVTKAQFLARLDGRNPADTVFVSCNNQGKVVGHKDWATRALSIVGEQREYSLLRDNCHQFVAECVTGFLQYGLGTWQFNRLNDYLGEYYSCEWAEWV